jgi:hypothetical protein
MTTLALCNQALARVASPSIGGFSDNSVEATEINRVKDVVMSELLDWTEWHWSKVRGALAVVANDRPDEWNYAYALPSDCLTAIAVRETLPAAQPLPITGPYTFPLQDAQPLRFEVAGSVLFTNVENAILVYSSSGGYVLPPLVAKAYVETLAARICYPLKKDAKLEASLEQRALAAQAIAIADERNKAPTLSPRYVSDAEYARAGMLDYHQGRY